MSERRVVITGLGLATSLGHEVDPVWKRLIAGDSGIVPVQRFDTSDYPVHFGGEITDWEGPPRLEGPARKQSLKKLDRFAQFGLHASMAAVEDAGLDFEKENRWRCGSIIGTGIGGMEEFCNGYRKLMEKGPSRVSPFMVPKLMCNAGSGNVSIHFGIQGPNFAAASACASAAHAIGDAAECIRYDAADVMITGGAEAALNDLGMACFVALKALSRRNDNIEKASRPFDADRDGFVLSEGAGIIVLEEYEHAKKRGARIYAELMGYGQSADGSHITAPREDGAGASYAMEAALKDAGLAPDKIDYVNAHGTSTGLGDLAETTAVKKTFGADTKVPVSSTKSMTGHTLGASGGIEAVILAKAIETGQVPPTINLDTPGEGCDLDYVPNVARELKVDHAMSNSFGFGGHNVSLVVGRLGDT